MPILPDYELMLEQIYRAALRPGDIAVDIGAHEGRHTLPMARAVGPSGSVFAFEPLPNIALELRRVIEESGNADPSLGSIVLHQIALGENEGMERFVYLPDAPGFSGFQERVYPDDSWRRETIDVQVRRLDAFGADVRGARFIKVDAEGGELTILRGAAQVIDASMPIVSFELGNASLINYQYTAADYFDFFAERDYTVFSVFGIPLSREEFIAAADEQFFWDYIAIPGNGQWPFGHEHIRVCVDRLRQAAESSGGMQELAARDAQFAQIEQDLAQARQQLGTCEGELVRTRQKLKAVQAHLAGVLSSWSWRVTEPTRRVKAVLRRASARLRGRSALTPGTAVEGDEGGSATVFGAGAAGALDIQALLTDIRAELGHSVRSGGELNSFAPPVPSAVQRRFRAYWMRLPPRLRYNIGRTPMFLWAKDHLLRRSVVRRGP